MNKISQIICCYAQVKIMPCLSPIIVAYIIFAIITYLYIGVFEELSYRQFIPSL